jgi:large subunit ribosomal protein L18
LYAQLIDDVTGTTLKGVGTSTKAIKSLEITGDKTESFKMKASKHLGAAIGAAAKEIGIERVIFDRGSRKYHGIIKALADSARAAGLNF